MDCDIVVRPAEPQDLERRLDLVYHSLIEYDLDAFLYFFFQELTLEACVLCGAVLFIFCGCGVWSCVLALPALAAACGAAVLAAHRAAAHYERPRHRAELFGLVAEYRGPLRSAAPPRARIVHRDEHEAPAHAHRAVVGTLSVCAARGSARAGWLRALCVARGWRRRGVGGALVAAAARRAHAERLHALGAATSCLQGGARAVLHAAGWEVRGSYERPLLGAALTLPMTQLALDT